MFDTHIMLGKNNEWDDKYIHWISFWLVIS